MSAHAARPKKPSVRRNMHGEFSPRDHTDRTLIADVLRAAAAGFAADGQPERAKTLRKRSRGHHDWTQHGHACCRWATLPTATRPNSIARCGGPAICKQCAIDAGLLHAMSH